MKEGSAYRADIDGLRALAVLAVVLFHLHVPGFGGGYVGVDVFFVISGFLITGFIETEIAKQSFSLRGFYLRRVRRLGPALLVVTVPTVIGALLLLYPEDMRSFAASLALQFVALQNVFFLADGEYFRGSDGKPLLHTWTLAVEEQFYLLWPLFLLLTRRLAFIRRMLVVLVVLALSLVSGLALLRLSPKAGFFLLPPRAWELGVGGAIALIDARSGVLRARSSGFRLVAGVTGLVAITVSIAAFTATTPFPGLAALAPVAGAALVVAAGTGGDHPVGRLLAGRAPVAIGLVSYPLYLWHWPLIAFAHALHVDVARPAVALLLLVLSTVLAALTYRFVETPIRSGAWLRTPRRLVATAATAAALLVAFAIHAYATEGAAYRYRSSARAFLTAPLHARSDRCGLLFRALHPRAAVCTLRAAPDAERRVLLWGNSHADMWAALFVELGDATRSSVHLNARNCRATPDVAFCGRDVQAAVLREIDAQRVTDVVLASSWYGAYDVPDDVFEQTLREVVAAVSNRGVRVWLLVDTPLAASFDPLVLYREQPTAPVAGTLPLASYRRVAQREHALFEDLAARDPHVRVLDVSPTFCDAEGCSSGRDGVVWYRDTGHLTDDGARAARAWFLPVFGAQPAP